MSDLCYQLPGLVLGVAATPARVREALAWLFQVCPRTEREAEVRLEAAGLDSGEVEACLPDWVRRGWQSAGAPAEPVMVSGPQGESAAVGEFEGLLFCAWCTSPEPTVRLVCGVRPGGPTRSVIPSVLFPVLRDVLLKRGRLMLHAAALRCPAGPGMLLVATSGGGKTTTSLALVRRGARLVSDDLAVVALNSEGVEAGGIPKPLNLRHPTLGFFEELRSTETEPSRSPGRRSIPPQRVYGPDCLAASCPVEVLYFLRLAPGSPGVRPIENRSALGRLIRSHMFALGQATSGESVVRLCELLDRVPAYELDTGDRPELLGDWLLVNSPVHTANGEGFHS